MGVSCLTLIVGNRSPAAEAESVIMIQIFSPEAM